MGSELDACENGCCCVRVTSYGCHNGEDQCLVQCDEVSFCADGVVLDVQTSGFLLCAISIGSSGGRVVLRTQLQPTRTTYLMSNIVGN